MPHPPSKSLALKLWKKLGGSGPGRWLFSKIICFVAPYFGSIKPVFTALEPGYAQVAIKKRRSIQNHIKSVHAIAMCNAAELAAGTCLDITLRGDYRWIPIGMEVEYLKIAKTDLRATCRIDHYDWDEPQDVTLPVSVTDTDDVEVFVARIRMRISRRKTPAT